MRIKAIICTIAYFMLAVKGASTDIQNRCSKFLEENQSVVDIILQTFLQISDSSQDSKIQADNFKIYHTTPWQIPQDGFEDGYGRFVSENFGDLLHLLSDIVQHMNCLGIIQYLNEFGGISVVKDNNAEVNYSILINLNKDEYVNSFASYIGQDGQKTWVQGRTEMLGIIIRQMENGEWESPYIFPVIHKPSPATSTQDMNDDLKTAEEIENDSLNF